MKPFISLSLKVLSSKISPRKILLLLPLAATCQLSAQSSSLAPDVQNALAEGNQFEQRHQLTSALDSDRKALKLAKGECNDCYRAIATLQLSMELPKDAAATAATWASHTSDPHERSSAQYLQAVALLRLNTQKPNPTALHQADEALKQAAADNPADPAIHMLRGRALAALKLDADAKAEFLACAAAPGATPADCTRAKNFAGNIELARGETAPAFTISGPDGTPITLDSLAGKVVLIDFWATWCPPCNKDLPYIQSVASEFRKDNFVLLGVSSDSSESTWKRYKAENDMLGVQVRDSFDGLRNLFHVSGIPTYVVLDQNGMVRLKVTGTEGDIRGKIRSLLASPPAIANSTASSTTISHANAQLAIPSPPK